jgi:FixJ family two-component response regulator
MTGYAPPPGTVIVIGTDGGLHRTIARLVAIRQFCTRHYESALEYLSAGESQRPECIVLDLGEAPHCAASAALRSLAIHRSGAQIVVLSRRDDVEASVTAIKSGAIDYLLKPPDWRRLLDSLIRGVESDARRLSERARVDDLRARYQALSSTQRQVLRLLIEGKLNKQIAGELQCGERTVKTYRAQLMQRLQCTSLADLVRVWMRLGSEGSASVGGVLH